MNSELRTAFDLSPSWKFRLVEDLWDGLAANPEEVPAHDWQKYAVLHNSRDRERWRKRLP